MGGFLLLLRLLLLDRVALSSIAMQFAEMCVVYLVDSGFVLHWDSPWDSNNAILRTFRQTRQQVRTFRQTRPQLIPSWTETNKKIMAFRKRKHCCGPHALEVTNMNAVASNLPMTCVKSKSLPNSVIFKTELHLHAFLTLCSSSDSGKSLWTWRKTREARRSRSSQKLHT